MSSIAAGTTSTTGLVSTSDTTGSLVFQTGASATTALTLNTSQNATFAGTVTTATGTLYPLVSGTAVASTSGTSIDFTSIPSWVKRITVMFSGVSTSGTSNILIQLGSGSVSTSGYISTSMYTAAAALQAVNSTAGFVLGQITAAATISGLVVTATLGSNVWVANGHLKTTTTQTSSTAGDITLGGTLDRLRITTVNGTDTFDAGTINIMWE